DTAATATYSLSLHDALPIYRPEADGGRPLLQRFLRRCSYSGITLGIVLCKACVRLLEEGCVLRNSGGAEPAAAPIFSHRLIAALDRKSTRLNSSHVKISYAV